MRAMKFFLVLKKELHKTAWGRIDSDGQISRLKCNMQSAYTSDRPKNAPIERAWSEEKKCISKGQYVERVTLSM